MSQQNSQILEEQKNIYDKTILQESHEGKLSEFKDQMLGSMKELLQQELLDFQRQQNQLAQELFSQSDTLISQQRPEIPK